METIEKEKNNTHHGHAVKRFRLNLGIKQEALAADMGISQALVSFYEQKKEMEEDMIEKFAGALGVAPQLIKELEEDPVTIIIENNTITNENNDKVETDVNNAAHDVIHEDNSTNHFNPVEKIAEIFEKLLEKEQEKIALLEKLLKEKK
ncbi:MAG: helix-turn-helix transcriptional regulator [Prevotellaceae bacterium]|nr:helix-turn-helix transcriptional regulator [Prevotellaceae bacterium]